MGLRYKRLCWQGEEEEKKKKALHLQAALRIPPEWMGCGALLGCAAAAARLRGGAGREGSE